MHKLLGLIVVVLAACDNGGASPPLPDADLSLPMCTGQLYDACTTNSDCMSMNCKLFDQDAIQVCVQTCDASNPCPPQDGMPATCNNRGLCKPPAANACRP